MKLLMLCLSAAFLFAACGKSDDASTSSDGSSSDSTSKTKPADGDKPWEDLSKPYLDDKKMGSFVESLKDANGPFDAVSKGKINAFNAGAKMEEFEAAAKKHGFESGAEYLGAWMRIGAAMTQVMHDESNQSMIQMHEETIKTSQESLKKPDLTPEVKQMLENQIKSSQETIAVLKQPREESVNAKDVEAYKKHRAAFEEAMKKWK